jgi:hypothetical protein
VLHSTAQSGPVVCAPCVPGGSGGARRSCMTSVRPCTQHPNIIYHGALSRAEWSSLLQESRFLLGASRVRVDAGSGKLCHARRPRSAVAGTVCSGCAGSGTCLCYFCRARLVRGCGASDLNEWLQGCMFINPTLRVRDAAYPEYDSQVRVACDVCQCGARCVYGVCMCASTMSPCFTISVCIASIRVTRRRWDGVRV